MEKTRSQIEELDPLEGSVNRRDIFKKNLEQSLDSKQPAESDEDSGYDVRSISTSGQSLTPNIEMIKIFARELDSGELPGEAGADQQGERGEKTNDYRILTETS